jgi:hypothetical protein
VFHVFRRRTLIPLATVAAFLATTLPATGPSYADPGIAARKLTGRTFWVDPTTGSDDASGRTRGDAWRSLAQVSATVLRPGDTVRLRAGRNHVGGLRITTDGTANLPITVRTYGTGAQPVVSQDGCVALAGDWIRVLDVAAVGCGRSGFAIEGAHDTLRRVTASGNVAGVWIREGSSYALVARSLLQDNDLMADGTPGPDDDYGAFGVEVNGDYARVTNNVIRGHQASSPDYGEDGSAVEVYQAIGTTIDGNRSIDNLAFTELGGSRSTHTRVTRNTVTGSLEQGTFLMTRGAGQVWGPVTDTVAEYNDVRLTGAKSFGFGCYGGCTPSILALGHNTIVAGWYAGWADGTFASSDNVYGGEIWFLLSLTDSLFGKR